MLLDNHTKWHLYLLAVSPLVRISEIETTPLDGGLYRIRARVENRGGLPTYVSQQALLGETAEPVMATLTLTGATLVGGQESVDLGHLAAGSSTETAEWLVKVSGREATVVITAVSQKGGTDTKTIHLSAAPSPRTPTAAVRGPLLPARRASRVDPAVALRSE